MSHNAALASMLAGLMFMAGCISADSGNLSVDQNPIRVTGKGVVDAQAFDAAGLPVTLEGVPGAIGALRYTGFNAFEPTIGATSDGTLFMTAFGSGGGGGPIARSTDQGASWQLVTAKLPTGQNNPPNSNDPYVWVDPDTDRVFTNDLQALICSWLNYSDDNGQTWVTNPIGCGLPPGVHDHQTIGTAKPRTVPTVGYDNVLYYCVNRVADSVCSTSLNGGLSFGPLVPIYAGVEPGKGGGVGGTDVCGGLHGHIKSAPDGTTYLPKIQCGVPMVGKTVDDGLTWTLHQIDTSIGGNGHELSVAIDEAGNVYAFWQGKDGLAYLSVSTDAAETWTEPYRVSPPDVTAMDFPAIAAGAEGRIAFAYAGTNLTDGYNGEISEAEWHAYIGVITNALDANPTIQTVTANPREDPVGVGVCGRSRCPGIGDFIDITIDPSGRPWAAFADGYIDGQRTGTISAGFAGTLHTGPALRGDLIQLPALPEIPDLTRT